MKRSGLILVIVAALSSCKKDRICECAIETPNGVIVETTTLHDVSKKRAKDNCIGYQTVTQTASGTTYGNNKSCKLK